MSTSQSCSSCEVGAESVHRDAEAATINGALNATERLELLVACAIPYALPPRDQCPSCL